MNTPAPVTRANFDIDRINTDRAATMGVSRAAGGITFTSAVEVMEFAKLMALDEKGAPHLYKNVGTCLRITFQAIEWGMSPFAVADKSYEVNKRVAYESQLIHAVIESRAPLKKRLRAEYLGEGPTRQCKVWGTFIGEEEPHDYTSPMFKDIKVKNSPLWHSDPDQQLFYYASRSWARKWAPDVLMGIYTKDELQEHPTAGREEEEPSGSNLQRRMDAARTAGAEPRNGTHGAAVEQLEHLSRGDTVVTPQGNTTAQAKEPVVTIEHEPQGQGQQADKAAEPPKTTKQSSGIGRRGKPSSKKAEADDPLPADPRPVKPTDAKGYLLYAEHWIDELGEGDHEKGWQRWQDEMDLRRELVVPIKEANRLRGMLTTKVGES